MASLGLAIGIVFPFFALLLGVPATYALAPRCWARCLAAGLLLALLNWLVARGVVGRRLDALVVRMARVAESLRTGAASGAVELAPAAHALVVDSADGLGRTAQAFNDLLGALAVEHRFRSLVHASSDLTWLVAADRRISFASRSVGDVLGWPPEHAVGMVARDAVHPADAAAIDGLLDGVTDDQAAVVTVRIAHATGGWRHIEVQATDRRADPLIDAVVLTGRDVTERVELQAELTHQAHHDELTGLPNRAALLDRGAALVATATPAEPLAVLVMDLDRFKEINDTLGHAYGDRLLVEVAARITAELRDDDVVARLGGDEFAVLVPGVDPATACAAAERLVAALTAPFSIDGFELAVDASVGVAVSDGQTGRPTIDACLREADIAMYTAKDLKTGVEVYDPSADTNTPSRLGLLAELRRGLIDDQLVLHYQPKLSLRTGALAGVEALVRWQHPTRGLLPPAAFLPVVEQTGLIDGLTDVVLDLALHQVRDWLDEGQPVQVAVNVSPRSLHRDDLPDRVERALAAHDVPPALLRLEITESSITADPAKALVILERLHDAGITLSIDDFGTGYSSMGFMRRLPVSELKVDRTFVAAMLDSPEDTALVRSVIELGHNLGLTVVAEGIEDATASAELAGLSCDVGQGFLFARPQPAAEVTRWLRARDRDLVAGPVGPAIPAPR